VFRFKQFTVEQNGAAQKITTDSVLLGAWSDVNNAKTILDIGTGTGVIALMMAQRNTDALIDAIDIDKKACELAVKNFKQSQWSERLLVFQESLQEYNPQVLYDLIISNPPYFAKLLKSKYNNKNVARHDVALTHSELLEGASRLLALNGKLAVALPIFCKSEFKALAALKELYVTKLSRVISVENKPAYLGLFQLEREPKETVEDEVMVRNDFYFYTSQYRNLTRDFYLDF
jgi:tRNA1Val (adenine37-N6)-methyltransferase